jgi:hypothetical protein
VPTEIYFAGESVRVKVDEDPRQVAEAFASAEGLPICLTDHEGQGDVYINPATVAFWSLCAPTRVPEPPQESGQPGKGREAVTDIWGQPLRRKPRR